MEALTLLNKKKKKKREEAITEEVNGDINACVDDMKKAHQYAESQFIYSEIHPSQDPGLITSTLPPL